jgi:hypothetical protein
VAPSALAARMAAFAKVRIRLMQGKRRGSEAERADNLFFPGHWWQSRRPEMARGRCAQKK